MAGRTALVTGGGTGLGAAITRALQASGASVVITGRRAEPLHALAAELGAGGNASATSPSPRGRRPAWLGSLADREISIVINNAGIAGPVAPLTEIDVDAWDEVFDINVRGVFLVCRAFLPAMVARGPVT